MDVDKEQQPPLTQPHPQQPPQLQPPTAYPAQQYPNPMPSTPYYYHSAAVSGGSKAVYRVLHRHVVFKLGLCGLALGAVLHTVAFSSPAWASEAGLWVTCVFDRCSSNVNGNSPAWLDAVRSMESLSLVCFVFSLIVELYQDVLSSPPPRDNKAVEVLGIAAGVFGIIGVGVFGGSLDNRKLFGFKYHYDVTLNWAFGLAIAASCVGLISAVLVWFSRERHGQQTLQALANAGVFVPTRGSSAHMHPLLGAPPPPVMAGAGAPFYHPMPAYPYPYPYPYLHPAPATFPTMAPAPQYAPHVLGASGTHNPHTATSQGLPTSQIPMYFVSLQGQLVPVYNKDARSTMPSAPPAGSEPAAPVPATDQHRVI